jgi:methyl-accepting chemotaxis protein
MILSFLNNLRMGRRLGLAFAATLIPMMAAVLGGVLVLPTVESRLEDILQIDQRKSVLTAGIGAEMHRLHLALCSVVADDQAPKSGFKAQLAGMQARIDDQMKELEHLEREGMGSKLVVGLKKAVATTQETAEGLSSTAWKSAQPASLFETRIAPIEERSARALDELGRYQHARMEAHLAEIKQTVARMRIGFSLFGVSIFVLSVLFVRATARSITLPLARTVGHLDGVISDGNFTLRLPDDDLRRKDEIGDVARLVDRFDETLRSILRQITSGVQAVASTSTELASHSSKSSEDVRRSSGMIEEMFRGISNATYDLKSVASGMQDASGNLASVSKATEEMTTTMADIASDADKAKGITGRSVNDVEQIAKTLRELSQSANQNGKVTETITSVAAQTNLLALNATIEAARAGAAGKGFAVVANEIQNLAQETASASDDIKNRISAIQRSTAGVLSDMKGITQVIAETNETVTGIAKAIEQQSATIRVIAHDVSGAAQSVKDGNERASRSSSDLGTAAGTASAVAVATREASEASEKVHASVQDLARVGDELRSMLAKYRI